MTSSCESLRARPPVSIGRRALAPRASGVPGRRRCVAAAALSLFAIVGGIAGPSCMSGGHEILRLSLAAHVLPVPACIVSPEPVRAAVAASFVAEAPRRMAVGALNARETASSASVTERATAQRRPGAGSGVEIRKRIRADHVAASLERGYAALLAEDVESAANAYRQVLGHEPRNRDALLGLAAVAAIARRWDEAAGFYARVLAFHPGDSIAEAALIAVDGPGTDRGASRLKALVLSQPRAAYLHFALGNAYAAQSRWSEARQSYRNAHYLDGANPDYAYNLAVSLDHLVERGAALHLYREALALAGRRPASFDTAAVVARIRTMGSADDAGNEPRAAPAAGCTAAGRPEPFDERPGMSRYSGSGVRRVRRSRISEPWSRVRRIEGRSIGGRIREPEHR